MHPGFRRMGNYYTQVLVLPLTYINGIFYLLNNTNRYKPIDIVEYSFLFIEY